jgi:hypothetical protein
MVLASGEAAVEFELHCLARRTKECENNAKEAVFHRMHICEWYNEGDRCTGQINHIGMN